MASRDARQALRNAEALFAAGRVAESEAAFGELLASEVRAEALFGLGVLSYTARNLGRAQALFEQSIGVNADRIDTLYYLGRTLLDRGSGAQAIKYFAHALSIDPNHAVALRDLIVAAESAAKRTSPASVGPSGESEGRAVTDVPEVSAPSAQALGPPLTPSDPNAVVGVVKQLMKGVAPYGGRPAAMQHWTFRVEDPRNARGVLGVEMRGFLILGALENGDWVEIAERPQQGKPFSPQSLRNLTTNTSVKAERKLRWRDANYG